MREQPSSTGDADRRPHRGRVMQAAQHRVREIRSGHPTEVAGGVAPERRPVAAAVWAVRQQWRPEDGPLGGTVPQLCPHQRQVGLDAAEQPVQQRPEQQPHQRSVTGVPLRYRRRAHRHDPPHPGVLHRLQDAAHCPRAHRQVARARVDAERGQRRVRPIEDRLDGRRVEDVGLYQPQRAMLHRQPRQVADHGGGGMALGQRPLHQVATGATGRAKDCELHCHTSPPKIPNERSCLRTASIPQRSATVGGKSWVNPVRPLGTGASREVQAVACAASNVPRSAKSLAQPLSGRLGLCHVLVAQHIVRRPRRVRLAHQPGGAVGVDRGAELRRRPDRLVASDDAGPSP